MWSELQTDKEVQFSIRNATLNDVEDIMSINRISLPENYPYYFFQEHVVEYARAFFVAEVKGEVVGYIMPRIESGFSVIRSFPNFVKKGHVVSIAVLPSYRGMGIGGNLLDYSLSHMKSDYGAQEVYLEVRVSNDVAIRLYEKKGFKKVRTLKHYYMDGEDAFVMAREL
ncbi:ribosomal-protein-alanine N-acetyltransferase RimI [Sulfolobales archaeon HS-7]|nr:ribosomal-protein-alanine N-acetyltransferase RimI [Sulfolobales archaeon HS-7]